MIFGLLTESPTRVLKQNL